MHYHCGKSGRCAIGRGQFCTSIWPCATVRTTDNSGVEVSVTDDLITFHLVDGRVISVPLAWSWRLSDATPEQRNKYEIIGDGQGVHWPDVDEDLSVEGMFHGVPARRPKKNSPRAKTDQQEVRADRWETRPLNRKVVRRQSEDPAVKASGTFTWMAEPPYGGFFKLG